MNQPDERNACSITWERARAIFSDAPPPAEVWERQFDQFDEELRRLAATSVRDIKPADLWFYFLDLAYVELQPELFAYLFPVCLMHWHETLQASESCDRFQYGLWKGEVLARMLTPEQRAQVVDFFRDSFLERIDAEPVSVEPVRGKDPFAWIERFNSLGLVIDRLRDLWEPWWSVATGGRAVAVLKYCSGFVYPMNDNPIVGFGTGLDFRFSPQLWQHDSDIPDASWREPNLRFLRDVLSFDYLVDKVGEATRRLTGESGEGLGDRLATELLWNQARVERRLGDLFQRLAGEHDGTDEAWLS